MMTIDQQQLLTWINTSIADTEEDKLHAIEHKNFGKAAILAGEINGLIRVKRQIELGDFTKNQ